MVPIGFDVKFMEAIEGFCWERERERERERGDYDGWWRQCHIFLLFYFNFF
jgi:hypothetical protein